MQKGAAAERRFCGGSFFFQFHRASHIQIRGFRHRFFELMKENRFVPLAALAVSVALAFLGKAYTGASAWQDSVLYGLVMGLSAMGLYSGGKSLIEQ